MNSIKKINFKSKTFFYVLISVISLLLLWNLYLTIIYSNILGLIPISIQVLLLILILSKNRYAKVVIRVWAIVFLILGPFLQVTGKFLQDLAEDFANTESNYYLPKIFTITIGILVTIYAGKKIEIIESGAEENHKQPDTVL